MRSVFFYFFLVTGLSIYGQSDCLDFNLRKEKPVSVVFTIYGNDCFNCYIGASNAYQQLYGKYPVVFLLGNVPKRIKTEFVSTKIGKISPIDTVIINDSLFSCLNPEIVSKVFILKNEKILWSSDFKNSLVGDTIVDIISSFIDDTIDVSKYVGTKRTKFNLADDGYIYITNDLNSNTYCIDVEKRKLVKTYNFNFLRDSIQLFIKECVMLDSNEQASNVLATDRIDSKMGNRVNIMPPIFKNQKIYLPLTFLIEKASPNGDVGWYHAPYIAQLSLDLTVEKVYSLHYSIPGSGNVFNYLNTIFVRGDTLLMMTSSENNDSLIAQYYFTKDGLKLENVFNLSYPDYFPIKNSSSKYRIAYTGYFGYMINQPFFVFNVDPTLYFFNKHNSVRLTGLDSTHFNNSPSSNWIDIVYSNIEKVIMVGGLSKGPTYYFEYIPQSYILQRKVMISDKQINVFGYFNEKLFYKEITDEDAWIIVKDVKYLME
ncbi:MAG: hypothetical protein IPP77_12425 [Bacteroidetes bacterium]|nr:hypothetical protein [Bacteroidota bacterium]